MLIAAVHRALLFTILPPLTGLAQQAVDIPVRGLSQAAPAAVGLLASRLKLIDSAAAEAIRAGEVPGAVVLVARHGRIGFWRSFGDRALEPDHEAMTNDTIFVVASLTKVVATTPAIMVLVEDARLRLDDRVRRYLPKFTGGGKDAITRPGVSARG